MPADARAEIREFARGLLHQHEIRLLPRDQVDDVVDRCTDGAEQVPTDDLEFRRMPRIDPRSRRHVTVKRAWNARRLH